MSSRSFQPSQPFDPSQPLKRRETTETIETPVKRSRDELDVSLFCGIPFREKGRGYDGCDCWGIPYLIYRDVLGIELPLYTDGYHNTRDREDIHRLMRHEKAFWQPVIRPQPFDILHIRIGGDEMHCGVYIGNSHFIHCLDGVGACIERVTSPTWRQRIVGYYRYPR